MEFILQYPLLIIIILIIFIVLLVIYSYAMAQENKSYKNELSSLTKELEKIKIQSKAPASSKEALDYIREFTTQVSAMNFRNFVDTHDMTKVTKATIVKLVEDTAKLVHKSINMNNINFDNILFTEELYYNYIIDISMISIKNMLDKAVNEVEEE